MDIDALKTFVEVSRTRHFGQAGENLFISQSTVSARIRQLEEYLGVSLFHRERNNIRLTAQGERLLEHADSIINTWNRARFDIGVASHSEPPLVIGAMPSLWDIFVQNWLNRLSCDRTGLAFNAEVCDHPKIVRRIIDGSMDVGFVFEVPQLPEVTSIEVMHIPLMLVSSVKGLSIQQAMSENYILVDWGTSFVMSHAQHFPHITSPRKRFAQGRLARDFILDCGGCAYLAEPMVKELIKKHKMFYVKNAPVIDRVAYAVYSNKHDKREIKKLISDYL